MDIENNTTEMKKVFDRGIINTGNLARIKLVMKRAIAGDAITIGFIGGSITAGALSSSHQTCYAYLVYTWWKERFSMSNVKYINAGIGATDSKFGVARVEEDMLNKKPDIVFAEFSVNDFNNELLQETFEGLVRRILLYPTEPALFMFNNVMLDNGNNTQIVHNQVGKFYDIPIVSMKDSIFNEIQKGTFPAAEISSDYLHPNDLGHKLLAGLITNLLDFIYEEFKQNKITAELYHVPDNTVTANRFYSATVRNGINTIPRRNGFIKDDTIKQNMWDIFKNGWIGRELGSSICFEVESWMIAIQYRKYAEHPAPIAKVVINQDESNAISLDANFKETWGDCLFLQDIMVSPKTGKHTVEIVITEAVEGKDFYLTSVITA